MKQPFDIEKITKKFYERFQKEHAKFLPFIQGIPEEEDRACYTSLMLNRLMFIYFLQKKGFLAITNAHTLDGDHDYLRHRLHMMQQKNDAKNSHSFYRDFLLRLFHEGLGKRERSPELEQTLGKVLSFNGALFDHHMLERTYPHLQIADEAFEHIFDFFDSFHWHLDDRPVKNDNTINPDVLGYIFEQYSNQQEMGAYYTKEDVTTYIAKNTIIPALFAAVSHISPAMLQAHSPIWRCLHNNPNRYIYTAVRNQDALSNETKAEYCIRRTYYTQLYARLKNYQLHTIDELLTYNLDICQFAQDTLIHCQDSMLLRAFYEALTQISILDPTVGSGAFLFAALTTLEPLYKACLDRMEEMGNHDQSDATMFRGILQQERTYPHRRCFILMSIITNNLYGVDIMPEATEICKLRLWLKLLASVEHVGQIIHLPALGEHIRTGNALMGSVGPYEYDGQSTTLVEKPFDWWIEFPEVMRRGGFDVILSNPPYVEYNAQTFPYTLSDFATLPCGNLYPCVVERSRQLLSPQGRYGMILPLAAFSTKNMLPLLEGFLAWFPCSWLSFYHFRPSMLFSGRKIASIPTVISLARVDGPEQRFSTHLTKWTSQERATLFSRLTYCPITLPHDPENRHYYPKYGHLLENRLMEKIMQHKPVRNYLTSQPNHNTMFYRSAGGLYWKVFINSPWPYQTTSNKQCFFDTRVDRDVFVALFNSSLFWWYYTVTFDTFNLKDYMLFGFRFTYPENDTLITALQTHCQHLMTDFYSHAQHLKRGKTDSYTIYARKSKPILDDIDHILAQHYGLTDEERDFIINYDHKYRMGLTLPGKRDTMNLSSVVMTP